MSTISISSGGPTTTAGVQQSLFGVNGVGSYDDDVVRTSFDHLRRTDLGNGSWVDFCPGWASIPDRFLDLIERSAPWRAEEPRIMYDRSVSVPRLTTGRWAVDRPVELDEMAATLGRHYRTHLLDISANLYRDGSDSVAWHGDRIGRDRPTTVVAILSLGSPRRLLIRPNGRGPSTGFTMHSGDLVVMGGRTQRTHEHCVPKRARAGQRISIMFREACGG